MVYLVIDGLGEEQLLRFLGSGKRRGFLGRHLHRVITTVSPATTAAAVTTFATGASPAEHGVLGWFLHLPDLGLVSTILPATTRTGTPMAAEQFSLKKYLRLPSYMASVKCRTALLSYGEIPRSRYSKAGSGWDRPGSFTTLKGMERRIVEFARGKGGGLAYAYWPEFDTRCHAGGTSHAGTLRHLAQIDRSLARLVRQLRGTGTALLVTADHGLVDTPPGRRIELRDVPGFYDCLAMIPSGDARQVQCFVRPAKVRAFRSLARRRLHRACVCVSGEALLRSGVLGPGKPHPALEGRVGDFVLIAREGYTFAATPAGMESGFNEGNHGGLSATEVLVPLYVVWC